MQDAVSNPISSIVTIMNNGCELAAYHWPSRLFHNNITPDIPLINFDGECTVLLITAASKR
jgi:hypothetical protein